VQKDWQYYHDEITTSPEFLSAAGAAFGDSNWVLVYDNEHIHICKAMVKALSDANVSALVNWSPYSPAPIIS
jgi:hypothetical protein